MLFELMYSLSTISFLVVAPWKAVPGLFLGPRGGWGESTCSSAISFRLPTKRDPPFRSWILRSSFYTCIWLVASPVSSLLSLNNSKNYRLFLRREAPISTLVLKLCNRPIFSYEFLLQMFRSAALTLGDWVAIPGTGCEFVTIQPYDFGRYDFVLVTFHHSACGVI